MSLQARVALSMATMRAACSLALVSSRALNSCTNTLRGSISPSSSAADGSLMCYYGPCQYTSARLLTNKRFEIAYGRVEARIKVAKGSGLWPAFWMLGTDLDRAGWPQAGEIDVMEHVDDDLELAGRLAASVRPGGRKRR